MGHTLEQFIHRLEDDSNDKPTRHSRAPTDSEFLKRLMKLSAIRCAMYSWGQPLEAIIAALLLNGQKGKR